MKSKCLFSISGLCINNLDVIQFYCLTVETYITEVFQRIKRISELRADGPQGGRRAL